VEACVPVSPSSIPLISLSLLPPNPAPTELEKPVSTWQPMSPGTGRAAETRVEAVTRPAALRRELRGRPQRVHAPSETVEIIAEESAAGPCYRKWRAMSP